MDTATIIMALVAIPAAVFYLYTVKNTVDYYIVTGKVKLDSIPLPQSEDDFPDEQKYILGAGLGLVFAFLIYIATIAALIIFVLAWKVLVPILILALGIIWYARRKRQKVKFGQTLKGVTYDSK